MMKPPTKSFPLSLVTFTTVVDSYPTCLPPEVTRLRQAILEALGDANQRKALSLRFCRLREQNRKFFNKVIAWLNTPNVRSKFSSNGAHWAWLELLKSISLISNGEKPHVAVGMNRIGRHSFWGFTVAEDAAIYAQYLHLNHGLSIYKAKLVTANIFGTNIANINKAKILVLSADEAFVQAKLIKLKRPSLRI